MCQAGFVENERDDGLQMVHYTAIFYSGESLLEHLNGETNNVVEDLAVIQDHGDLFCEETK